MLFGSRYTSRRIGRFAVPLLACLALPLLVTCGGDNPTQSRSTVPARVVVTPETADLASAGQSARLSAQALDGTGQEVPEAPVTWRSSDPSVATVSGDGLVTAVGEGSAVITAMTGQKTGSARVTVSDPVRRALVALYRATGGENWHNSDNWLTNEPVQNWHGVTAVSSAGSAPGPTGLSARAATSGSALNLPDNGLSGPIPPELGDLTGLRRLVLSGNGLSGPIPPELGNLALLEVLDLSDNQLSGRLPSTLGNLGSLRELILRGNADLSGPLPLSFARLDSLETLDLSDTGLCAPADTTFQTWLRGVSSRTGVAACSSGPSVDRAALVALYEATDGANWTNDTNWLSDRSLGQWHGVSVNASGRVDSLTLAANGLTGTLPAALGDLDELVRLDLSDNRLTGAIPLALFTLKNLTDLDLTGNRLSGQDLTDREVLTVLYHATNGPNWVFNTHWLSDEPLGEWYGVTTDSTDRVTHLRLYTVDGYKPWNSSGKFTVGNGLSGSIPSELGSLSKLTYLNLRANQLSGSIPSELGSLSKLTYLNLQANQLSSSIPSELGRLSNLTLLTLSDNQLSGSIPAVLGNLSNLTWLTLWNNQLSGSIPPELGSLTNLETLNLTSNQLSGSIPSELGRLSDLKSLSLENNQLSGSIPSELGNLSNLTWLTLWNNQLSGSIPAELGNLNNLTRLDLENNQLSGSIPAELGSLSELKVLYLSDNLGISGSLPGTFTGLANLYLLHLDGTGLCAPSDAAFQAWLRGISNKRGVTNCVGSVFRPDLVVSSPSVSDDTPDVGASFTLRATVRNQGDGQSAATTLRYYRSSDSTISTSDTEVGTDSVSALSALGTSAESISLTAPLSAGTYYYGACVDAVGSETNTDNNCSAAVRATVTVIAAVVLAPAESSIELGETQQYEAVAFTADGTMVPDAVFAWASSDEKVATVAAAGLATGVGAGQATVSATAEGVSGTASLTVTNVAPDAPDLIVASPSVDDSTLTTGQSFTFSATVRNQGTGASASTTLRYYRSSNSTISTSDTEVGTDSVSALSASGTSAESISLTAPSSAGTYYYGACVDGVSGESDTGNNCSSAVTVTLTADDDHGNIRTDATSLSLGSSRSGRIETGNDVDYFRVEVSESGTLTVYTTGSLDTTGELEDGSGSRLADNDDGGAGSNFRIERSVSSGTYYVKVESFSSNTGSYTLHSSFDSGGSGGGGGGGDGGACTAGLIVNPGESCTYKNGSFSVADTGIATLRAGALQYVSGNNISLRNTTVNGVRYNFQASRNSGGNSWTINEAD